MLPSRRIPDLTGLTSGRLVVVGFSHIDHLGASRWKCLCSCGNTCVVRSNSLRSGKTKSCGCFNRESAAVRMKKQRTIHGHGRHPSRTATYRTWCALRTRCNNPRSQDYKDYGGRGIRVCPRWDSFENFLSDMGERPKGLTIERMDNDGDYEPSNCKWATNSEQQRNKRKPNANRKSSCQAA